MKKVQLFTANKEFVTTLEVPSFSIDPKVLIWGLRTFVLSERNNFCYYEALTYWAGGTTGEEL